MAYFWIENLLPETKNLPISVNVQNVLESNIEELETSYEKDDQNQSKNKDQNQAVNNNDKDVI